MNAENASADHGGFLIVQDQMDWARAAYWESIFSLSNGLLGTRGSFEEPMPRTPSRPATFMAGLYNALPDGLPEWPPLPDWLETRIQLGGQAFDLRYGRLRRFARRLDMRRGVLERELIWEDFQGRSTALSFARFLSLTDRNIAALRIRITPLDWSGPIRVEATIGEPPPAASSKKGSHWEPFDLHACLDGTCRLISRTTRTRRPLAVAGAYGGCSSRPPEPTTLQGTPHQVMSFDVSSGETLEVDRFVAYVVAGEDEPAPIDRAVFLALAAQNEGFDGLLTRHVQASRTMWNRMDVIIDGPAEDQLAIRYNLFQLATLCPRPGDLASIGPKGLTGTAYSGHIFWDTEIYMVPFFALTHPEGARTLLEYRCTLLDGARRKAKTNGYRGAQYPWESADTGDEACPKYCPDPITGEPGHIWCGDIEDHITADVPYAVAQYVRATGDDAFMWDCGAEITFETARFWADRVTRNHAGGYDIRDAMGPNEYHIHVNNDALTNHLACWNLLAAADLYENRAFPTASRDKLLKKLDLSPNEPRRWREIADGLTLNRDEATGLVAESDGFLDLPDVSPDLIRAGGLGPLTSWFGDGHVINAQVCKQAEVVALLVLLEDWFDRRAREVNFDYYEPRTCHDSSLSVSMHAIAAARLHRVEQAYEFFRRSAHMELQDLAGNTASGLHAANMGGMWMAIAMGFAGLKIDGPEPTLNPCLPATWKRLQLNITHLGRDYTVDCTHESATVRHR